MRILVLSDKIPSLRLGDGLRAFGLYRPLTDRHRFDLVCFARQGDSLEPDLRSVFTSVHTQPFPEATGPSRSLLSRLREALSVANFKAHTADMQREIARRIDDCEVDLVLDLSANMLLCLPQAGKFPVPLVVDSIDEPLLRDLRALTVVPWSDRLRLARQAFLFWRYERALLARADQNIYASEVDVAAYQRFFPGRPAVAIPNGVDIDYFAPLNDAPAPATIVFEGNMMFGANVDAARHLVFDVLPRLVRMVPDVQVQIVGRDPSPAVKGLASDRVRVTGTVPDIRPYVGRATVFVCPMRLGSGIKNKILQAWAMGRPVVATNASLGGLSAADGSNVLVRDSPETFAEAVAQVIHDRDLAVRLGQAGRDTVEREYSWAHRASQFEQVLFSACAGHRAHRPVLP